MNRYNHIKFLDLVVENDEKHCPGATFTWADAVQKWSLIEERLEGFYYDVFGTNPSIRSMLDDFRRNLLRLEAEAHAFESDVFGLEVAVPMLCKSDVEQLKIKDAEYGSSWKRRGGVGAFMMMTRKWDRLEQQIKKFDGDFSLALRADKRQEGVRDDVGDLRRYLILIEAELVARERNELA